MLIVEIEENAGFGNQLFQYAHGYALAKRYNQKIHLISYIGRSDCVREYMLDQLQLDYSVIKKVTRVDRVNFFRGFVFKGSNAINRLYRNIIKSYYRKKINDGKIELRKLSREYNRVFFQDAPLLPEKDYYTEGFYESYKYFYDFKDEIRNQLKLKLSPTNKEIIELSKKITSCNSVAVHIRVGDFAICNRIFPIEYYDRVVQFIEREIDSPEFFLFSENNNVKDYFKNKQKENINIVNISDKNKDILEWYLMSLCHHHVLTNSTFSWWSAFAADYSEKRVFIPPIDLYLERENADIFLEKEKKYNNEHYYNYFLPEYEVFREL